MTNEPTVVERGEQPYAAITGHISMDTFDVVADRLPELFGWLASRGTQPLGSPFFRYNLIGVDGELEVEAGVAVPVGLEPEGDLLVGLLPGGRYVTSLHTGHPDTLIDATTKLLAWGAERGLEWDMRETPEGERWACRLEVYRTDPRAEPDMGKWETELAFRLAD